MPGVAGELEFDLLLMVLVDVDVSAGPDELSDVESGLLGDHVRQQRVGRNVERDAEEHVCGTLIQLAGQLARRTVSSGRHIELEESVARRQGHVVDFGRVPGGGDMAPGIRVVPDGRDNLGDLVDAATVLISTPGSERSGHLDCAGKPGGAAA